MYATFIQPFTDIVHTANYAAKRIGTVTGNEFNSLLQQSAAAVIPFVSSDTMDEIQEETKNNIKASLTDLDQRYASVINRNIDAIVNQTDTWGMLFLLNPSLLLGSKLMIKAPKVAADFLGTILKGTVAEPVGNMLLTLSNELRELDEDPGRWFFSQRKPGSTEVGGPSYSSVNWSSAGDTGGYGGDYGGDIGGLYELNQQPVYQPQQQQQQPTQQQIQQAAIKRKKEIQAEIQAILKDQRYKSQLQTGINQSTVGKRLTMAGIRSIVNAAKKNLSFSDWNGMLRAHSKNKGMKSFDQQLTTAMQNQNMSEQQIIQTKNKMVPAIKQKSKQMFITHLQNKALVGISKEAKVALQQAIQQINSIP